MAFSHITADSPEGNVVLRSSDVSRMHSAIIFLFIEAITYIYIEHSWMKACHLSNWRRIDTDTDIIVIIEAIIEKNEKYLSLG